MYVAIMLKCIQEKGHVNAWRVPVQWLPSILIEQLSRTSKGNRIHDTIQSATESNIMQHSQVDSTSLPDCCCKIYNNLTSKGLLMYLTLN